METQNGIIQRARSHTVQDLAFLVGSVKQVGNPGGLVAQSGQADDRWRLAIAPVADRLEQRNAVVVLVFVELLFHPLGHSTLARSHARYAGAKRWNEGSHVGVLSPIAFALDYGPIANRVRHTGVMGAWTAAACGLAVTNAFREGGYETNAYLALGRPYLAVKLA
jgi:hypothetical protein